MSSKLTQQTIPSAGGFTNAQGLSSPSSHAGQTALAGEPTPITPATRSAVESAHTTLPATTSPNTIGIHSHSSAVAPQQSSSSRSTTTAGGPDLDVGGAISSRIPSLPPTDREQPNIPQTAEGIAQRIPTAEELKQQSTAAIERAQQLAQQAREQAGELVAPKAHEDLNPAEQHVDSLATGFAGMIVTAPLAGIEKVSPVVADKISHGADVIAQQLQHARDQAAPVAASYLEQAKQTAQAYLPTALGGNVTQQQAADRTAELANSAKATAADTTNVAAAKAQDAGSATTSTLSNAAQQAAATAKAYLPESVGNKLPGGAATTSTSTTSTTTSVDSPYVNRSADKPTSTLPSTTLEGLSGDKAVVPDFSSGTGTSKQFSGLQPATTDSLASTNTLGSTSTGALKSTDTFGSTGALHSTGTLGSTGTSVEHPTQGAPMYTKPATGDFKTDQTSFAPAEYAADKHAAESTPLASKSRETSPVEVAPLPITSTLPEPIPHIEHPAFKSDKGTTHGEPKPFKAPEPVVPAASVAAPAPPAGAPPPTPKPIDVPAPVDAAAVTDTTTPHQHHQQSTEEPSSPRGLKAKLMNKILHKSA